MKPLKKRRSLRRWWQEKFVTVMVIPERTRRVHRLVIPFFALKLGGILLSLVSVFFVVTAVDYVHVLRRTAENKRLKGENFKLRREVQLIRNKVDSMTSTVDRVRNYAKKLQVLTGQEAGTTNLPWNKKDRRTPAGKKRSSYVNPADPKLMESASPAPEEKFSSLDEHVASLKKISYDTELLLSGLEVHLLAQRELIAATPSLLPINGWISSMFGYRRHPVDGSYRLHAGVDIVAEPGTPVRAPADGRVIYSGLRAGYGKVIVIDHGYGIRTLFAHNSKLFKTAGTVVNRGDTISEVGTTGRSTGPHLHYEIRKNGRPVNPVTFFSSARF